MTVLAANTWHTNADLIADVAKLYLRSDMAILDPTYGRGLWWTKWHPDNLWVSDRASIEELKCSNHAHRPSWIRNCAHGLDFTEVSTWARSDFFDAVAFDPPYVSTGGRDTTTMPDFAARYGLTDAPRTPKDLQEQTDQGLASIRAVLVPGGILLVKCQDYISSGKMFPGTHHTLSAALSLGYTLVDRLEHIARKPRPQPPGRRQVHARRNLSTMLVFRK